MESRFMNPVAGWYSDPQNSDAVRYWDGVEWTNQTAPLAAQPSAYPAPVVAPTAQPAPAVLQASMTTGYPAGPVTQPGTYVPTQYTGYAAPRYFPATAPKNPRATRALVWGIIGMVINPFALPSILAIVFGAQGRTIAGQMERAGIADSGRGRSTAGLVLGIVGAVFFGIWLLFVFTRN